MDSDAYAQLVVVGRLALAVVLGALVGWEREIHHQQAGFRTYALVCLGAAAFTGVSGAAFGGGQDPTRIAAQVVSGIGFIAAGTILRGDGGTVRGLSTAAGLWAVAAIGVAVGAGLLIIAVGSTLLTLFVLEVMKWIERPLRNSLRRRP